MRAQLSLMGVMRLPTNALPNTLNAAAEAMVSLQRVASFMENAELQNYVHRLAPTQARILPLWPRAGFGSLTTPMATHFTPCCLQALKSDPAVAARGVFCWDPLNESFRLAIDDLKVDCAPCIHSNIFTSTATITATLCQPA